MDDRDEPRLRELFEHSFGDEQPPVDLWTKTKRRVTRHQAQRRATAAMSALAAVVIAVLAGPALLDSLESRRVAFLETPSAEPSAGAQDAIAGAESARERMLADLGEASSREQRRRETLAAPARLHAVTAGGPGLVAVGSGADELAGIWTSPDGVRWQQAAAAEGELFDGLTVSDVEIAAVAGAEPLLVALAGEISAPPRLWTSADGQQWAPAEADPNVFEDATVMDVTAGGPGLVAVGFEGDVDEVETLRSAVWVSAGGDDWRRILDTGGEEYDGDVMELVAAGGPGLVAIGRDAMGTHVWTSSDGDDWERSRLHLETRDGLGLRVVALGTFGPEVVAIAYTDEPDATGYADAFLLRSRDGKWSETWLPPEIFARLAVRGIVELDGRLVLAGDDEFGAMLWESEDGGRSWTLVEQALTAAVSLEPIEFPRAKPRLADAQTAFGVYVSVGFSTDAPQLADGIERLDAAGFASSLIDVACDAGASDALDLDEGSRYYGASVYFDTETDAWRFITAWKRQFRVGVVGFAEIERRCPE